MFDQRRPPDYIKLALPKGKLLPPTANLLGKLNLGFKDYNNKTRDYRLQSATFPYLSGKIFQERDIPIQVAIGNYDFGICGLDWIEEFLTRYPTSALVKLSSLNYGEGNIYVAAAYHAGMPSLPELQLREDSWRIVSEYPNLAEAFALTLRLKDFRIFPVWGAAEVYPPEGADLAVLWAKNEEEITAQGLVCLSKLLHANAFFLANRESLENKDLSQILTYFGSELAPESRTSVENRLNIPGKVVTPSSSWQAKEVNLALPDGHLQAPTSQLLSQANFSLQGYSKKAASRRPSINLDWVGAKVIRPQDMPLQVANGNFDLAITGEDWLQEHLYRFPSSPVMKLLDLGFGQVKIVAAVSQDMPATNIDELRALVQGGKFAPLRVASEYVNIADKYLRDNHIHPYKLIPTWGASEAFLPEDADLLIDNVQTGKTLAQHRLRIINMLFQSAACLIGNKDSLASRGKKGKIDFLMQKLRAAL